MVDDKIKGIKNKLINNKATFLFLFKNLPRANKPSPMTISQIKRPSRNIK